MHRNQPGEHFASTSRNWRITLATRPIDNTVNPTGRCGQLTAMQRTGLTAENSTKALLP